MQKTKNDEKENPLEELSKTLNSHLARIDLKPNVIIALLIILALTVLGTSIIFILLVIGSFT